MSLKTESEEEILRSMDDMRIVDHHEHLHDPFLPKLDYEIDLPYFLALNGYFRLDLVGAGMDDSWWPPPAEWFPVWFAPLGRFLYLRKPCVRDESDERWKEIKPSLEKASNTINYRYLILALRELYGFEDEELNDDNWREISVRIREKSKDYPGWAKQVLDKMRVFKVNLDLGGALPNTDLIRDDRLVQVVRMDVFLGGNLKAVEKLMDDKVRSFDQYLEALDEHFEAVVKTGAVGVKIGPMGRGLYFADVTKSVAEKIFNKGLDGISQAEREVFMDFMMHAVCEGCAEHRLPLQIHTGPKGQYHTEFQNSSPVLLTNLFEKHLNTQFDVFHGGYPHVRELGILARGYPNVYADACWLHQISASIFKQTLSEWIEVVPSNKIFAWGGDHWMPIEHSYGSLALAKRLVAEVMASKVASGYFNKKIALDITERIIGENAINVYGFK